MASWNDPAIEEEPVNTTAVKRNLSKAGVFVIVPISAGVLANKGS
jgi:hypothetical protein